MKRRLLFPIVVLVVSSIACSTFTRSTPENTAIVESTPTIETTMSQAEVVATPTAIPTPDLNSVTIAEELPPLTFDEVLDARVESGEWTEGEGLLKILQYFVDPASSDLQSILSFVHEKDATSLILLAQQLISESNTDAETLQEIERILGNLFPSRKMLEAISQPRAIVNSLKVASPPQGKSKQSALCEDLRKLGLERFIEDGTTCLESIDVFEDGTFILYYPLAFVIDEGMEKTIDMTIDAIHKSVNSYIQFLDEVPSTSMYFQYLGEYEGQIGGVMSNGEGDCTISVYPPISKNYQYYNQAIAALIFNCYENYNFNIPSENDYWWYFGGSEYYSNLVYPEENREFRNNIYFDLRSTTESITAMDYENFVFFQYLGNQGLPVLEILDGVARGESLSQYVSENVFNAFVVDYLSIGIPDSDGVTTIKAIVPIDQLSSQFKATISKESSFYLSSPPFTATRYLLDYEQEKRFLQLDQGTVSGGTGSHTAVEADLYQNKAAWSAPPEEIRSFCEKNKKYLYVSTTTSDNTYNPIFEITKVEEASCDPCLLGVWKVDNEAFSQYMMNIFEQNGVDFTQSLQGMGEFYLYTSGNYFLGFGEGGEMGTWRNNFTITVGITNLTSWDTVIESVGVGNYSADGKFLTISDLYDQVQSATAYQGDADISEDVTNAYLFRPSYSADMSDEDPTRSGDRREYKCDNNRLEIYHDTEGTLVFDRADALIPTPIPTATNP